MAETNLREAENIVTVEGILSEKALEKTKEQVNGVTEDKIKGKITIKTSDTNFVQFNVNVNRLKKADQSGVREPNKIYAGLETIMEQYMSIADVGEEQADRVSVTTGQINAYHNQNTGRDTVSYKSNFFNRVTDNYSPKAEFKVELFVKSVVPEVRNGEETGRAIINGWLPTYNSIEPLELIVEEDEADTAMSYFEPQQTYEFWGDIVATRIREEKILEGGFGKARKEVKTTFKNELICTGSSDAYDEEANPSLKPYDVDAINLAIQERKDKLNNNNTPQQKARPSASSKGRALPDF